MSQHYNTWHIFNYCPQAYPVNYTTMLPLKYLQLLSSSLPTRCHNITSLDIPPTLCQWLPNVCHNIACLEISSTLFLNLPTRCYITSLDISSSLSSSLPSKLHISSFGISLTLFSNLLTRCHNFSSFDISSIVSSSLPSRCLILGSRWHNLCHSWNPCISCIQTCLVTSFSDQAAFDYIKGVILTNIIVFR